MLGRQKAPPGPRAQNAGNTGFLDTPRPAVQSLLVIHELHELAHQRLGTDRASAELGCEHGRHRVRVVRLHDERILRVVDFHVGDVGLGRRPRPADAVLLASASAKRQRRDGRQRRLLVGLPHPLTQRPRRSARQDRVVGAHGVDTTLLQDHQAVGPTGDGGDLRARLQALDAQQ